MSKSPFRFLLGDKIENLLARNNEWRKRLDPAVLAHNAKGQKPQIFWIGCADSRAGEQAIDLLPGEVLVHRNVANLVPTADPSSQAAIQLAMDVAQCNHIIVCGHTDCKGVHSSLSNQRIGGSLDAWLRNLRTIRAKYKETLFGIKDYDERVLKLVELNVIEQVWNVRANDIVREHIKSRGVQVHGVIYDVATGLISKVEVPENPDDEHFEVEWNPDSK